MKLLLDTHALVWWIAHDHRLSATALNAIAVETSTVYVSVATAWEIAIKVGVGKWPEATTLLAQFEQIIADGAYELLAITVADARVAGLMQSPHRDPFDRVITAQAIGRDLKLVSGGTKLSALGANIVW